MATTIGTALVERSCARLPVSFTDDDDTDITPTTITWTWTDGDGNVINSRSDVAVGTPDSTIYITVEGDDVDYDDGPERILTVKAVGNINAGAAKTWYAEARYQVEDLKNV